MRDLPVAVRSEILREVLQGAGAWQYMSGGAAAEYDTLRRAHGESREAAIKDDLNSRRPPLFP